MGPTLSALWAPAVRRQWVSNPSALGVAVLDVCYHMGLSRRVLHWRSSLLQSVVEFGLGRYLPIVAPRSDFHHSRVEVLMEMLDGPPALGRRFVEVGVHLARVAFALLAALQGLQYIGVDPFSYDDALTPAGSAARQLSDLGPAPESNRATGAVELKGEV